MFSTPVSLWSEKPKHIRPTSVRKIVEISLEEDVACYNEFAIWRAAGNLFLMRIIPDICPANEVLLATSKEK